MGFLDKLFGKKNNNPQAVNNLLFQKTGNVVATKTEITREVFDSLNRRYIAFDVETTGLSAFTERIVELGAVVFENGTIVNQFSTLVNPGRPIPAAASQVNHITNDMLRSAPVENQVYPSFVNFLGDTLQGNTIICAHNAKFDMDFLSETLKRLGYNGNIRYVDTLALSRKYLKLDNYKQDTVAASYGIVNQNAHRAVTDAEVCGKILWELLKEQEKEVEKQEKKVAQTKPSEEEMEVCALIQNAIKKKGGKTDWISFYRNSNGYVDVSDLYSLLKFKVAKKGKYIIIPSDIKTPSALPVEKCTASEGGTNFVRMYFTSPFNLEFLSDHFYKAFKEAEKSRLFYFKQVAGAEREAREAASIRTKITDAEAEAILSAARGKNYDAVPEKIDTGRNIKREDVTVNAVHNRCPISQIKNLGNFDKGFEAGFGIYEQAEEIRKNGDIEEAIKLYDKARSVGYVMPALYTAYAKAFRKIKDYDNEIVIIEEFMQLNPDTQYGELEARREKAIELLYDMQQAEKVKAEKEAIKKQKQLEKEAASAARESEPKTSSGRAILQMDDAGNIIKEFESVTLASKEAGVSPKSIRDAAKGVQKHAGGFVWKYKDKES